MEWDLNGKVAIVTGGSSGIGLETAERFHALGASVVVAGRDPERIARAEEDIRAVGGPGDVLGLSVDVGSSADCTRLVEAAADIDGGIDILVNNAGSGARGAFLETDDDRWYADIEVKLMAPVRLARLTIPHMLTRGGGRIVNISAIHGKHPQSKSMPTSVTRAAGIALTKALSKEFAEHNILVNDVSLGVVRGRNHEETWQKEQPELDIDTFYRQLAKARGIPLGRVGERREAADLITFLVSDHASFITGSSINLDGGASFVT